MKVCNCYKEGVGINHQKIPYCSGTKELDCCSCGGDKSKCDFYENIRKEGTMQEKGTKNVELKIDPYLYVLNNIGAIIAEQFKDEEVKSIQIIIKDNISITAQRD